MNKEDFIAHIGIDPGQSGGIAVIYVPTDFVAGKMGETERDTAAMLTFPPFMQCFAWIERVHSMPKQGVASSFKFGQSYGFLRGLLIGKNIPFEEVTPQKWQKEMNCLSKGDKNVTKARAQQLWPGIKITHAIADALLIAEYGRRIYARRSRGPVDAPVSAEPEVREGEGRPQ